MKIMPWMMSSNEQVFRDGGCAYYGCDDLNIISIHQFKRMYILASDTAR